MLPLSFARLEFKVYGLELKVCKGQPFLNWLYTVLIKIPNTRDARNMKLFLTEQEKQLGKQMLKIYAITL